MTESYVVPLFLGTTSLAVLMLFFVMGVLFVQKNKQNNFKRKVLEARIEEQERTVNQISSNLHNDVAQLLSHVQMSLNYMSLMGIEQIQDEIQKASSYLTEVAVDVRHMSHSLSSEWLRNKGLIGAITEDLDHICATNQVHCQMAIDGKEYDMKHETELAIFRIVQDVVNNMFKHSKAANFKINVEYQPEHFTITFIDDGKGFNPQQMNGERGIGLVNMHSRAKLIGGELQIISAPGKGCRTILSLPVTEDIRMPTYND